LSLLLLGSIAILCVATLGSLWVARRSGDARVTLLTLLLTALAGAQALTLWSHPSAPAAFDLGTLGAALGLAASVAGLFAVLAVWRILGELDRAETLHWESMEGVRGLTELAGRREVPLRDKLPLLLEMGCERLGLELGLVSRIRDGRYELLAVHAPEDHPLAPSGVFPLEQVPCRHVLESERPVAVARLAEAPWGSDPVAPGFRFGAFLCAVVPVDGEPFGTLAFASAEPRADRFTASHKDLLLLMAQWIGSELEREAVLGPKRAVGSRPGPASTPLPPLPRPRPEPGADAPIQLNKALRRLERRIRRAAGKQVEVVVKTAAALPPAKAPRLPFEVLVLSLVRRAREAMPQGGTLTLTTGAQAAPNGSGAADGPGWVTLSVSETGGEVTPDSVTRAFDTGSGDAELRRADGSLPLAALHRVLLHGGGDLSVAVEPGRGSTYTVFLPAAGQAPAKSPTPGPRPPAAAPPASP
jgi:hypothetical protein